MSDRAMQRKVAEILLEIGAVELRPNNPFTYVSGIKSPIYCDNRILMSFPEHRKKIISFFVKKIKKSYSKSRKSSETDFDFIAGTATSGIPWAAWISEKLGKPMVYVKPEKKDYGQQKQIEGRLESNKKVIVIEDLISTGGSSISAVQVVRNNPSSVEKCFAIFSYELAKSKDAFANVNCEIHALTNLNVLADVAVKKGKITPEEKHMVLEWQKNPDVWNANTENGKN